MPPTSFRFDLTTDTLVFGYMLPTIRAHSGLAPVRLCPCRANKIKSFDCGDADLNDFLFSDAIDYYKSMMALTYLLEDTSANKTVAYYSLLNDKIVFDPDEKKLWNRLNRRIANSKRRKEYPAVKIGRLAISKEYTGQHLGTLIILQLKYTFSTMNRSACRFLTVDAYADAVHFYEKCGFNFLSEKDRHSPTRSMYFDLINFQK